MSKSQPLTTMASVFLLHLFKHELKIYTCFSETKETKEGEPCDIREELSGCGEGFKCAFRVGT